MLTKIRPAGVRTGLYLLFLFTGIASAAGIEDYRLTERGLQQFEKSTEAMFQFMQDNPELARKLREEEEDTEDDGEDQDIAAMTSELDQRAPGLRAKVEKSGMKLEEYFTFSVVFAANAFGAAMADQYGEADNAKLTELQRANLAFVRKYRERIEQFNHEVQEKYGTLDDLDADDYGDEEDLDNE